MILILIAWNDWENHGNKIVVSTESGGIAQAAQFISGSFMDADRTQITTDKGTFVAIGTFQLIKGDEIYIENRASGERYICGRRNGACNKLG